MTTPEKLPANKSDRPTLDGVTGTGAGMMQTSLQNINRHDYC